MLRKPAFGDRKIYKGNTEVEEIWYKMDIEKEKGK